MLHISCCRHDLDQQETAGAVLGPNAYSPSNSNAEGEDASQPRAKTQSLPGKQSFLAHTG